MHQRIMSVPLRRRGKAAVPPIGTDAWPVLQTLALGSGATMTRYDAGNGIEVIVNHHPDFPAAPLITVHVSGRILSWDEYIAIWVRFAGKDSLVSVFMVMQGPAHRACASTPPVPAVGTGVKAPSLARRKGR